MWVNRTFLKLKSYLFIVRMIRTLLPRLSLMDSDVERHAMDPLRLGLLFTSPRVPISSARRSRFTITRSLSVILKTNQSSKPHTDTSDWGYCPLMNTQVVARVLTGKIKSGSLIPPISTAKFGIS